MEASVYMRMADHEDTHWWYTGRRAIIERLIGSLNLHHANNRILEVGCGTGGNLGLLQRFGSVDAVEFNANARIIAQKKSGLPIGFCELPNRIDATNDTYDLIALLDVLEHIDDDRGSLHAISDKCKPGRYVLITVPAYRWLWSAHDEAHHHKRRYTRRDLRQVIMDADLMPLTIGHFNALLLPAALAQRLVKRVFRRQTPDDSIPPAPVNKILSRIFMLERHFIGKLLLPVGLSIYAVAKKTSNGSA